MEENDNALSKYRSEADDGYALLPGWFTTRMMNDEWYFFIYLSTGKIVSASSIQKVWQSASGDVWIDVTMTKDSEQLPKDSYTAGELLVPLSDRSDVSINTKYVVAVRESAFT